MDDRLAPRLTVLSFMEVASPPALPSPPLLLYHTSLGATGVVSARASAQ